MNGAAALREWDDTEVVPPVGFRGALTRLGRGGAVVFEGPMGTSAFRCGRRCKAGWVGEIALA